jgi:hypothetical protein
MSTPITFAAWQYTHREITLPGGGSGNGATQRRRCRLATKVPSTPNKPSDAEGTPDAPAQPTQLPSPAAKGTSPAQDQMSEPNESAPVCSGTRTGFVNRTIARLARPTCSRNDAVNGELPLYVQREEASRKGDCMRRSNGGGFRSP